MNTDALKAMFIGTERRQAINRATTNKKKEQVLSLQVVGKSLIATEKYKSGKL